MTTYYKGRVERPFHFIENNFLAGRTFNSWEDLNAQLQQWCKTNNGTPKRALGMSPDTAYIQERPYLKALPKVLPPIYQVCQRIIDTQGFASLDSNRYSVPERLIGCEVNVYKYLKKIEIYFKSKIIATHERIIGKKNQRVIIKGHHNQITRHKHQKACNEAEQQLVDCSPIVAKYIKKLKSRVRGRGFWQFRKLLNLKRTYSTKAFIAAIERADKYDLYDIKRVENLIIKYASDNLFNL